MSVDRDEHAYALFRQALVDGDPDAWRELYARYENLVAAWVRRHPGFLQTGETVAYFVNRAFDRLYTAVGREKFARFPNAGSLLRYLKMCVHAAILDAVRQQERRAFEEPSRVSEAADPEAEAVANLEREELWAVVQSAVRDERERILVYECFVCGATPQQLHRRHPQLFPSTEAVYLAKRSLLQRLRRHPRIQALHG
ncbi:MAG: hypothetical protein RMM30_02970 [Armatimonadota bacterium]|nr:hypothetical protein [Armatimonadota bacterium]MDW8155532.1 hypothetical protein [Armatimonadota bacterium]